MFTSSFTVKYSDIVVSKIYSKILQDYKDHLKDMVNPNIVYVTDLVSCSQKRIFRQKYPELIFRFDPIALLGILVHRGLEELLKEYGFENEVEILREIEINGKKYVLKGRVDSLNETSVVEIKTARSDLGLPHEHHIGQLQIYLNLLNKDKGVLIYITPDRIAEFSIEKEEININELLKETLENSKHPRWSWECLHPDTLIFTPNGYKPVKLVKEGGKVIGMDKVTKKYRVAIVTKIIKRRMKLGEQCFLIEPAGLNHIIITENHPIFVRFSKWGSVRNVGSYKQRGYDIQITSRTRCRIFTEPQWLTVKEVYEIVEEDKHRNISKEYRVQPWMYIPYPTEVKYKASDLGLTDELLWLLGLTIADGTLKGDFSVRLTIGAHEKEVKEKVKDIASHYSISCSPRLHTLPSPHGEVFFIELGMKWRKLANKLIIWEKDKETGRYAPRKHFTDEILYLSPNDQKLIIEGMVTGGGHIYADGSLDYATTSPKLAYQLVTMLLRQKILPSLKSSHKQYGWGKHPVFHVRWSMHKKRRPQAWFVNNGVWVRIKKIIPYPYKGEVYNFEVKDVENYLTPAGIVHNCRYCAFAKICPYKVIEQ